MAVAVEAVTLVSQLITICNTILQIVLNLNALGGPSGSFQSDIGALNAKLKLYDEQIRIHGDHVNDDVVIILERTKLTLEKIKSNINYLKENFDNNVGCFWRFWLYAKLFITLFSCRLDKAIRSVKGDLDNISKIMDEEPKVKSQFQQNADFLPIPTTILDNDSRYVPIEDSQSAVLAAIEDFDGPRIVLLHGGVGKGKSTLSRYACKLYGKFGDRKDMFHFVLLVNCTGSSKLDPSNKQFEILRHLSPASLSNSPESENSDLRHRIAKSLHDFFLSGKKILIILDDVSDDNLISEMWKASEGGTNVRYLVTSQYPNLCDSFKKDSFPIAMGDPNKKEAMQILASLVGLEEKIIPKELQGIAAKIIEATGGNPLALACLASNFAYHRDKTKARAWIEAYNALCSILDHPETTIVLGRTPDSPPRSLWAAMKICFDSLDTSNAKDILFLLYACQGETIPEEVLRILYAATNTSNGIFLKAIEELRSRELVKCSSSAAAHKMNIHGNNTTDQQESAWSLLTTVKLYITHHMAGEERLRSVYSAVLGEKRRRPGSVKKLKAVLGDDEINAAESSVKDEGGSEIEAVNKEKDEMAVALCALYFDEAHTDNVVAGAATQACNMSKVNWTATVKDLRRKALEPLIWLLDQLEEEDLDHGWTESSIHCARQVFLRYVCDKELDDENINRLLRLTRCPFAQLATLTTLADILTIEQTPLLKNGYMTFLGPLVDLLGRHVRPIIQEAASRAMLTIADNSRKLSESILRSTPHLLMVLVTTLEDSLAIRPIPQSNILAQNAVQTLWNLSHGGEEPVRHQISSENGVLAALAKCLLKDDDPILQQNTARAVGDLAAERLTRLRILSEDGMVEGLVGALSKDQSPKLQEEAARALAYLAEGPLTGWRILRKDGVVEGLVGALSKDQSPKLQEEAARALANLAGRPFTEWKILSEDGVVEGLVGALSKDQSPKLQEEAARALANLAARPDSEKSIIISKVGVLEGLVGALSKDQSRKLQKEAARALANLASGPDSEKCIIISKDGVLEGLVGALPKDQSYELQEEAARALANLARGQSMKLRILSEDGVLEGLVGALSKDQSHNLQNQAARALANLASGPDSEKCIIISKDGVLEGLVGALSKDQSPKLQNQAARALANLAMGPDSEKCIIISKDGVLEGLVGALSENQSRELEEEAARALANLAGGQLTELKILSGVVEGLVRAFSKDQSPKLQEEAARALANLAGGLLSEWRILSEDGVLEGLAGALSKDQSPNLQNQAARALDTLATGQGSAKCIVMKKDGVLARLVGALSKEQSRNLQNQTARAFVGLATRESTERRIFSEDGVLEGLVGTLLKDQSPELQNHAARAIGNLVAGPDSAECIIISKDGVLEGLVGALLKVQSPILQNQAATALAKAKGPDTEKCIIMNKDGVLVGLVEALSKEQSHNVQNQAARASSSRGVNNGTQNFE